jgi:hypothetical protein
MRGRWPRGECAGRAIAEAKQHWTVIGWLTKIYYLDLLHASECTLAVGLGCIAVVSTHTPHWARVVGYGPFTLCVIQRKGRAPALGMMSRLMMI